jgi:hypothetical protein
MNLEIRDTSQSMLHVWAQGWNSVLVLLFSQITLISKHFHFHSFLQQTESHCTYLVAEA